MLVIYIPWIMYFADLWALVLTVLVQQQAKSTAVSIWTVWLYTCFEDTLTKATCIASEFFF